MWRARLILVLFLLWFFFISARLFYWQIYSHDRLLQTALNQQFFRLEIPATRGEILASDGLPLVANQQAYLVYAEPKKIQDKKKIANELSRLLQLDEASISASLSQPLFWVPLKHKVSKEVGESIKAQNLAGVGLESEDDRFYPEGSMSAQLMGFVGSAYDGSPKGYFGLEGYYDREIRGRFGVLRQAKDANGIPILIGLSERLLPEEGKTLRLYLDRTVQFIAEEELKKGVDRYQAKGGTVTIMDPKTGGILAMAALPSYDSRRFTDYDTNLYRNPIISDSYEPGSTFKVLVMAGAVELGLVTPDMTFPEPGPIEVGGYKIRTWNDKYNGALTTTQILEKSSNVGMVAIAQKMGKEKLLGTIKNYDFGKPTGVDLEEEVIPELRPDDHWKEIDLATASFGQGIAVTPLQMVRSVVAIANGGRLLEPHVVAAVSSAAGKTITIKPKVVKQVIKPDTAKTVTEMMVAAVDQGEAKRLKPPGYKVAGKTGTAQIPVAGHYESEKTIASFVGFAPAYDPRYVMLVTVNEPKTSPWGSETAAPIFFEITKRLFAYYGLQPS